MSRGSCRNPALITVLTWLLVVMALLATRAALLPAMILGAAALDGGHRVACGTDAGGLTLRLAQRSATRGAAGAGEHSCLLRIFVRETGAGHDHQFRFVSPGDALADSVVAVGPVATGGAPGEAIRRRPGRAPGTGDRSFALDQAVRPALDRLRGVVMRA